MNFCELSSNFNKTTDMCFIIPTLHYGREKVALGLDAATFIPMGKGMIVT